MAYVKPDGTRNKHQKVLVFINILEEFRDLTLLEWNFRALLEKKTDSFLGTAKDLLETTRDY